MRIRGLLGVLALLLAAGPAHAVEEIDVPERAVFRHERTQISFPPNLGGMERGWIRDFGTDLYDVAALYQTADQTTFLTFYVYRAGLPDVSIWFDRLVAIMAAREGFHPASSASLEPALFQPTGSETPTGLALAYDLAPGQPNKATGAIVFAHGSWLIKLRATSSRMNAVEISQLLAQVERSLSLPEPAYLSPPAYVVRPCATRLASGNTAIVEPEQAHVTAVAVMMDGVSSSKNEQGENVALPGTHWCRDDQVQGLNVYRPDDATDRYVVAFGDSGNALQVGIVMPELPGTGRNEKGVPIIYTEAHRTMLMAFVDGVPAPAAAWEIAQNASALGINDRDGNVRIMTPAPAE